MISTEIGNKPYREFVQYDPKGQSCWAVDNTLAGREQDEEFKKYISKLRVMVQEKSMEMSVKVPVPWMLLKVVMEGKGVRYCKYSELLEEALFRGYVREESPKADLDSMLKLFHILGLFYHKVPKGYKKEDSLVFIDPDCLYSATSDFLMAAKEEIEDSQGGDEERQHQTEAATKEEIADSQGGGEGGQHQTQAATMEETEDSQRGSEGGQHQSQAATMEETEDSQGGSEGGQHQTQAATKVETEDNQGGSEGGQHQTQAATKVETEGSQGGDEGGQHQTQATTADKRGHGEELAEAGITQENLEQGGVIKKNRVIERMKSNVESIQHEMKSVLQYVKDAVAEMDQVPTVVTSLHTQLKDMGRKFKPPESQTAATVKDKRHLFMCRLVYSLASSVEAVLDDSGRKGDAHHVKEEVARTVENVLAHHQRRSIDSHDMDQFLALLSDLRLVTQLRDSDSYVVPAVLPKVQHSVVVGKVNPLLVTVLSQTIMVVCYLPSGLFCCLISELVTEAGWTVHPLGRTHVAFTYKDKDPGRVHITECASYMKIEMESEGSLEELAETCQAVREKVHKSIISVYKNLYSDPTAGTTFEESLVWGFQCEEHPDDETHIAAFEEDEYECCAKCLIQSRVVQAVQPEQLVWFSSELEGF